MTLDELDQEARMHGSHMWRSNGTEGASWWGVGPHYYAVVMPGRLLDAETFVADTVDDMAAKLAAYWGRGKHATDYGTSQAREHTAMPYIGRRRQQ